MTHTSLPPYALVFAGQNSPWRETLRDFRADPALADEIDAVVAEALALLRPLGRDLLITHPNLWEDLSSIAAGRPTLTTTAALSVPGIALAQFAAVRQLQALGILHAAPAALLGHSQGVLGCALAEVLTDDDDAAARTRRAGEVIALATLIGVCGDVAAREAGAAKAADGADADLAGVPSPMLAVRGVPRGLLDAVITEVSERSGSPVVVALVNSTRGSVLSGTPAVLEQVHQILRTEVEEANAALAQRERGGSPAHLVAEYLDAAIPFHSPLLQAGADRARAAFVAVAESAAAAGAPLALSAARAGELVDAVLTTPVNWPEEVRAGLNAGVELFIDCGPGTGIATLTRAAIEGSGAALAHASSLAAIDGWNPDTWDRTTSWEAFAPRLRTLPSGQRVLDTAFTRLTGRSPVLLAGMTPTTVDPQIVAAAANAGYWAEMAGGGQVTEEVFTANLAKLTALIEPGRAAQFNSMFFDRYLWNLHFAGQRVVGRARQSGAPLDGVVISAGIPEIDEAPELVRGLRADGFRYIAFKPGTIEQIRQVIAIAEAMPEVDVIVHVEDGHAGGHHSWENLDDLLLATYAQLRARPNLVVCVGGGIGTPAVAADYLSGQWAVRHGRPLMPVDGVLIGTAAMTAKEATTSRAVKELLVATPGVTDNDGWVGRQRSSGGMTSGLSHLRADMHEVDNSAAAAARIIARYESNREEIDAHREEIIEAVNRTAKPYFGDLDSMTYLQWLERFVELTFPSVDPTWVDRYLMLVHRVEARFAGEESGSIATKFPDRASVEAAGDVVTTLRETYPAIATTLVDPFDAAWFPTLCRAYPKPMPFVPVIDGDILRWWGQDGLWQSHDERYPADAVRIIPGPVSVAGIDRIDEPIAELLGRFEAAAVERVAAAGVEATPALTRLGGEEIVDAADFILAAPHLDWLGHFIANPATALGERASHASVVARPEYGERAYDLVLSFDTYWDRGASEAAGPEAAGHADAAGPEAAPYAVREIAFPILVPASAETGAMPVIDRERLPHTMYTLLAGIAGVGSTMVTGDPVEALPQLVPSQRSQFGETHWAFTATEDLASLHTAVTAGSLPAPATSPVPDALLGPAWPAIYTALGSAMIEGYPVIEGLLNAVHLDHLIATTAPLPPIMSGTRVDVTAWVSAVEESSAGRVVTVEVEMSAGPGAVITLCERFAIRGRATTSTQPTPPSTNGALDALTSVEIEATNRQALAKVRVHAPADMTPFAIVSGDYNPIHTSYVAAAISGMSAPLVHGMWLSAAAQHVVGSLGLRLRGWTYNMYGMVALKDEIVVSVERVGRVRGGGLALEVVCTHDGDVVSRATAITEAPATAYVFPGQGIQTVGMGMDEMSLSPAARTVWLNADRYTREKLGFSILTVVRSNPNELTAQGVTYRHPEGVLNLTQFTQVALAVLAYAQTARLKEAGALTDGAYFAGHSLGEYNALSAYGEVFPLEVVVEIVFQRGKAMHELVERDDAGRSNYRMAAFRPNQCGISHDEVEQYVARIAETSGEFLQIVNYNLAGRQYAIAGTIAGIDALRADAEALAAARGGRPPIMLISGIDVPFHSVKLRPGVPAFRDKVASLLPENFSYERLLGRYIPNLVARPFSLERDFVEAIAEVVPETSLARFLVDDAAWAQASSAPQALARELMIELLSWQFASPVRWIETQEYLLGTPARIEEYVEIGLGMAPTLANLAAQTLKLREFVGSQVRVWNVQRDEKLVYRTDQPQVELRGLEAVGEQVENGGAAEGAGAPGSAPGAPAADSAAAAQAPATAAPAPATAAAAAPTPAAATASTAAAATPAPAPAASASTAASDLPFTAADAVMLLLAHSAKIRLDQILPVDTIETLTNGVSSRRNQILMDLNAELNVAAIDGAADATITQLADRVSALASHYHPFGSVLEEAVRDRIKKVFAPAGWSAATITDYLTTTWALPASWQPHILGELTLGTREGASVRSGDLAHLGATAVRTAAEASDVVDAAVAAVAARAGIALAKPQGGATSGGAVVDSTALNELAADLTGALASTARHLLDVVGASAPTALDEQALAAGDEAHAATAALHTLAQTVEAELGSQWIDLVRPVFNEAQIVEIDDAWALAREALVHLYIDGRGGGSSTDATFTAPIPPLFQGAGEELARQAQWWAERCEREGRPALAARFGRIAQAATAPTTPARYANDIAVVTGCAPQSIGAALVARLLEEGATVVATASTITPARLEFAKKLYRDHARPGARLWLVPANLAAYRDVDALAAWIANPATETVGGALRLIKPAYRPTLLFPFAAPRVWGQLADAGPQSENQMRVLLWSVERLIARLSTIGTDVDIDARLHVVLPGSPNRGIFGADGAYAEAKSAFEAICNRWHTEAWAANVTLAHPLIGWVTGTSLTDDVQIIADGTTEVKVFTTDEMADGLLALVTADARERARRAPLQADLTGGLAAALTGAQHVELARPAAPASTEKDDAAAAHIDALPTPRVPHQSATTTWPQVSASLEDTVVIVGVGEVGPWGSARTRLDAELGIRRDGPADLTPAGTLELAWMMGLVQWQENPEPGWYTPEGEHVPEQAIYSRFRDEVVARCGVRQLDDDGPLVELASEEATAVYLNSEVTFTVSNRATAETFLAQDPDFTRIEPVDGAAAGTGGSFAGGSAGSGDDGEWLVTKKAGARVRVPRRAALTRTVGGQFPRGFDPAKWGIPPSMIESMDRMAIWNLVVTVDAFLSAGFTPAELLAAVHPADISMTQGTGFGGMSSMRKLFVDRFLGEDRPSDILQETLPNVLAAHTMQAYIGGYGSMIHPVGACATAAVSIEEGVDKIKVGKALFVVAGAIDDLCVESLVGFGDMNATARSSALAAKGIENRFFSRPNDRRRGGFVEAQGGGTVLLARGDVAAQMGLPVLAVVGYAGSFADGFHTSIPAPGVGAVAAARGGVNSHLARGLARYGLDANDIRVISKHDTSTNANDPNETKVHAAVATALGRSAGNPLYIVSQKSLTGHSKGGAAAFQVSGVVDMFRTGIIPANASLDVVDPALAQHPYMVWLRSPLAWGELEPIRAALVTSLGFGHVSSLVALIHPGAFLQILRQSVDGEAAARAWLEAAQARLAAGAHRIKRGMIGRAPLFEPVDGRPIPGGAGAEVDMLLDPAARFASAPAAGGFGAGAPAAGAGATPSAPAAAAPSESSTR